MFDSIFIYSSVFFISIFFAMLFEKSKNKIFRILFFMLAISLPILIATIRYNVGTDFNSYLSSYNVIKNNIYSIHGVFAYYQEPLHVVINILAYKIFNSYKGFLFIASLIFMFFAFKGIIRFKDKISIPLAYFIFFMTFYHIEYNGTRQAIAAIIIFYAYQYIINRDLKKYVFYVVIATLFHKSALFALILYFAWIDKGKKEKKFYLIVLITTVTIPILTKIIYYICTYLNIYQKYFIVYKPITTYGFLLYIIPLVLIILLNNKNLEGKSDLQTFFMRMYILQLPLQLIGNFIPFADRLSLYALPAQIVLVPIFLRRLNKYKAITTLITVSWYIFYYIIMFIILNSGEVYPYQTFFYM